MSWWAAVLLALTTMALVTIVAVNLVIVLESRCPSQPTIHCPPAFHQQPEIRSDGEHIYCLRDKYEPSEE